MTRTLTTLAAAALLSVLAACDTNKTTDDTAALGAVSNDSAPASCASSCATACCASSGKTADGATCPVTGTDKADSAAPGAVREAPTGCSSKKSSGCPVSCGSSS